MRHRSRANLRGVDRTDRHGRGVGAGEGEQGVDEALEAVGLFDGGVELVTVTVVDRLVEALEAKAERSERRAQLVRRVGDEGLLGGDELTQPVRHLVEVAREAPAPRAGRSSSPLERGDLLRRVAPTPLGAGRPGG